ncbi:MAG: DUF4345 domain-containing protein, partial [Bacteroidota bacterium]
LRNKADHLCFEQTIKVMNYRKISKVYLVVSGILLTGIGTLTTFNPINVKANEGIELAGNPSALNDVRSFGFLLLVFAVLFIISGLKSAMLHFGSIASTSLFLSLGFGRVLSILLDGMPSEGMLGATMVELVLGSVGLFLLLQNKKNQTL